MYFPVTLEIKPSRRLRAAFFIVHSFGLTSLVFAASNRLALLVGLALLLLSFSLSIRAVSAQVLTLAKDGAVSWRLPDGNNCPASVLAGSVAFNWLLVLRIQLEGETKQRSLVILSDSLAHQDFRRMQVWIRWMRPIKAAGGGV